MNRKKVKKDLEILAKKLESSSVEFFDNSGIQSMREATIIADSGQARRNMLELARANKEEYNGQLSRKIIGDSYTKPGLYQGGVFEEGAVAQFDIQLTMLDSSDISGVHNDYVPVFGFAQSKFAYTGIMGRNETFQASVTSKDFSSTIYDGANKGNVRISSPTVPYVQLLEMLGSREFQIIGMRLDVSSSPELAPILSRSMRIDTVGMFGKTASDTLSFNSFAKATDNQLTIRDIPLIKNITPWTTLWLPVMVGSDIIGNPSYTISFFVQVFSK